MAMNDNRRRIRFRRGTNSKIIDTQNKEKIVYGQPLFNANKNYLSIGKRPAEGQEDTGTSPKDLKPVYVRTVNGWYSDEKKLDGKWVYQNTKIPEINSNPDYEITGHADGDNKSLDIISSKVTNVINGSNTLLTFNNDNVGNELLVNQDKHLTSKNIRTTNIHNYDGTKFIGLNTSNIQISKNVNLDSNCNLSLTGTGLITTPNLKVTTQSDLLGITNIAQTGSKRILNIGSNGNKAIITTYADNTINGDTTYIGKYSYKGNNIIGVEINSANAGVSTALDSTTGNALYAKTARVGSLYLTSLDNKSTFNKGITLKDTTTLSGTITNGSNLYIRNSDNNVSNAGLQANYGKITNLTTTTGDFNTINVRTINLIV